MMVDLQVDAVAVTHEVRGAEFAVATFRCLMCDHSTKCGEWLADPNRGSDAPAFCLDADFFNRHRERTLLPSHGRTSELFTSQWASMSKTSSCSPTMLLLRRWWICLIRTVSSGASSPSSLF